MNKHEQQWLEKYELAKKYYEHYEHLEVPQKFKTINGYEYDESGVALGIWIKNQRQVYKGNTKHKITKQHIKLLKNIGMIWDYNNFRVNKSITKYKIASYDDFGNLINVWNNYQEIFLKYPIISKKTIRSNVHRGTRNKNLKLRFYKYNIDEEIPTKINKYIIKRNKRVIYKNQMGVIYKISNDINNKVYIGQTSNFKKRKKQHFDTVSYGVTLLYKKMREIGQEHFTMEVIAEYPIKKLNDMEQYWIQYYDSYNNGYNSTPGGDVCNIPGKEAIPVLAYNKDTGAFFKEFSSISEAVRFLKLKHSAIAGIAHALDKEEYHAQGFIWKRKINNNYPQFIRSLNEACALKKQQNFNNIIAYIRRNIDNKRIAELKKEIKISFDKLLQNIKIKDEELYNKIIIKEKFEKKAFLVLINLLNKKIEIYDTQQEIADKLKQSQANVSKHIDSISMKNFIILSATVFLKHQKNIERLLSIGDIEELLNILNIKQYHFQIKDIENWQEKYKLAKEYYKCYGSLKISQYFRTLDGINYNKNGIKLGCWIHSQKRKYNNNRTELTKRQIQLLEEIGIHHSIWEYKYQLAKVYYKHHGNLKIPYNFKTINGVDYDENGIALGNWINTQRQSYKEKNKSKLNEEQIKLLIEIGMIWHGKKGRPPLARFK